jgi:cysteinyl-tRNA synthetase
LKEYSADTIRLTLQSHHYREPWECFTADLESADATVELFRQVRALVGRDATGEDLMLRNRFNAAMDNDLDTPEAVRLLREAADHAIANNDLNTGAEVLRQTTALGLCV